MKALLLSAAATVALCIAIPAVACPVVSHSCATPYVAPVVVKEKVAVVVAEIAPVAVYQPFPVFVNTFTVGYSPGAAFPGYPAQAQSGGYGAGAVSPSAAAPPVAAAAGQPGMAEVLTELRRLNGRLDALERGPGPRAATESPTGQPPPAKATPGPAAAAQPAPLGALAIFAAKCAACHQAGNETKGKGFVLLDAQGQLARLDAGQWDKVASKTGRQKMPPPDNKLGIAPLTDDEIGAVMAEVDRQQGATK